MSITSNLKEPTLAILAGGRSTRMGFPKSQLEIKAKPILHFLLQQMNWPGPTMLVTAPGREHPLGFELFDIEAVDEVELGPLGGVLTALQHCQSEQIVILPIDMPAIGPDHLQYCLQRLGSDRLGFMLQTAEAQLQPFPLACRSRALPIIEQHIYNGNRAMHSLLNLAGFVAEIAPADWPLETFVNLNHPNEFRSFIEKQD